MSRITENQKINLIRQAIRFGESLMPSDCADIIARKFDAQRRSKLGQRYLARLIVTMMEAASYECDFEFANDEAYYLI